MAELLTISGCDNPDRELDLIFVHGLDGDGRSTWQKDNNSAYFWPGWLGEEYPNIGVWSLDYEVSASDWKGHSMPLYFRAQNVLDLFERKMIGQRPIGFVCHSLGGLLVKQMLRLANEDDDWQYVVKQTRFIIFLSTPHSGADLANWVNYIKLLRPSVSVQELEAHNPQLLQLNDWYRNNTDKLKIKTFVYFETLPTKGILVVNASSANPGITGIKPIPLDENHETICKPVKKSEPVYERVKLFLNNALALKPNPEPDTFPIMPDVEQSKSDNGTLMPSRNNSYSGEVKLKFCDRLLTDWRDLADLLEIKSSEQEKWEHGQEARAIWQWLWKQNRLDELPGKLQEINRNDLAKEFTRHPK